MTTPISTAAAMTATPQAGPTTAAPTNGVPTDFMMLLAQIAGQPAEQAVTPIPTQTLLSDTEGLESDESADGTELLPFALAFQQGESVTNALPLGAQNALTGVAAQRAAIASQVQVVTDMIAAEQHATEIPTADGDVFQLPVSGTDATPHRTHAADPTARPIHVPVGNAQWADELGARLTTMTEQGKHAASLRLSPEHLGPLEIRISIRDDQASVWFGAAHADTRAAIEHALPRLREMFEAQGMALADAGVFHEAPREQPEFGSSQSSSFGDAGSTEEPATIPVRVNVGLVDAYA